MERDTFERFDGRRARLEVPRRAAAGDRYLGCDIKSQREHDREVVAIYRRLKVSERRKGNLVTVYRDDLEARRQMGKECYWVREMRRVQTGNPRYKLSVQERMTIAKNLGLAFDGRIRIADREALIVSQDGKSRVVKIEAVTRNYGAKAIAGQMSKGAHIGLARASKSGDSWAHREPYGPDILGRMLRSIK